MANKRKCGSESVVPTSILLDVFQDAMIQLSVSRGRQGRLELLQAFQGVGGRPVGSTFYGMYNSWSVAGFRDVVDDIVEIKMPEAGFMYRGSLADLVAIIDEIEKGGELDGQS